MKECELDLKDTFVQAEKELYKCVSLSEFIKKDTFVQVQKGAVPMCISVRIHQERHICTGAERAVQMSVRIHQSWAIFSSQIPRML